MKTLFVLLLLPFILPTSGTIYTFKVAALNGETIHFSNFKGKKILIVNTASKCGLTPQYEDLQALYSRHKDKLVIVGFPANDFVEQEPGSNADISEFCQKNYGVTFPMAAKVSVRGKNICPIYKYLIQEAKKNGLENPVSWNFGKFLIDEEGELIATFSPRTKPSSDEILKYLN